MHARVSRYIGSHMPLLRTLLGRDELQSPQILPAALRELYDGDLHFPAARFASPASPARALRPGQTPAGIADRPYVIANFVSTLDGAASFKLPGESSGATVSGSDPADRFIMGLLRASVDAVIVGAHTIHDTSSDGLWIPPETYPDAKDLYRDYRQNVLQKRDYPLVVIVTGSGKLDLQRAVFRAPEVRTLIITTAAGQHELAHGARGLPSLEVKTLRDAGFVNPAAILQLLSKHYGITRLLHEGGPTLFGEFLQADAVDEFFLTLAPQIAGRGPRTIRPGLVEGVEFLPASAPWFDLLTVKQSAAYLYLRYRRTVGRPA